MAEIVNPILRVARLIETATERALRLALDNSFAQQLPLNNQYGMNSWVGLAPVGEGGYGVCALFGRFGTQGGALLDRMVVKETWCNGTTWHDPVQWTGAANAQGRRDFCAGIQHIEHMENAVHSKLHARNPSTICGFRGGSVPHPFRWNFRTYLEFCPHSTLGDIINFYSYPDNFHQLNPNAEEDEDLRDIFIPEPFLWYVFDCLAAAAQVMQHGMEQPPKNAWDRAIVQAWQTVVHRDLKPTNVFLREPPSGRAAQWRLYPQPALGDFGLAIETSASDPNNPRAYRDMGSIGFLAPEQFV